MCEKRWARWCGRGGAGSCCVLLLWSCGGDIDVGDKKRSWKHTHTHTHKTLQHDDNDGKKRETIVAGRQGKTNQTDQTPPQPRIRWTDAVSRRQKKTRSHQTREPSSSPRNPTLTPAPAPPAPRPAAAVSVSAGGVWPCGGVAGRVGPIFHSFTLHSMPHSPGWAWRGAGRGT